jgi:phospholipid/cholesterol/gamma-HCH transport system permease protein
MMISMPLLVAECVGLSVLAGYFVATQVLNISDAYYLDTMFKFTGPRDVKIALTKGFFFALIIVIVSCHQGLNAREGAVGVGRAPTESVVISSLGILVANFFLSFALNIIYPGGV